MIQETVELGYQGNRKFNCYIEKFEGTTDLANHVKTAPPNEIFAHREQSSHNVGTRKV